MISPNKNILFLCTGNSCRSQMAEGFAHRYLGNLFNVYSAGTQKHGMNSRALKVMKEVGIDLSSQYSKTTDELPKVTFDYVITVCDNARESCPYFPGSIIIHHSFRDPPFLTKDFTDEEEIMNVYRETRDEIEKFVKNLTL